MLLKSVHTILVYKHNVTVALDQTRIHNQLSQDLGIVSSTTLVGSLEEEEKDTHQPDDPGPTWPIR